MLAMLVWGMAATVWAWAGAEHLLITLAAGKCVPDEMAAWQAWSEPVAFPSVCPDLWKSADHQEGPRHFFETDRLRRGMRPTDVVADRNTAFSTQIGAKADEIGVAPWVICDLLGMMSDAMRTNDWEWAARCGATMAHYAEDLHMPLHCIRNFNGQETGQAGAHTRIEGGAVRTFFKPYMIHPAPGRHLDDPFKAVMSWTEASAARANKWLRQELEVTRQAGGDTESEEYFRLLWEAVREDAVARIEASATDVASLWYTAWVDAGRPEIPPAPKELSQRSIWTGAEIPKARDNTRYDYVIWAFLGGIFFWALFSSAWRCLRNDRRLRNIRK